LKVPPVTGESWEWQDILDFSGNLLDESNLHDQIQLIKRYLSTRLQVKVFIWLDKSLLPLPDEIGSTIFKTDACSPLMERALAKHTIVTKQDGGNLSMAFPLIFHERTIGAMQIDDLPPSKTTDLELKLSVFAKQISTGLFFTHQARIKEWRNKQLDLVRSVSAKIIQQHDIRKIFRYVTDLVTGTFHYYFVAIYMLDEKKEKLLFQASSGKDISRDRDFKDIFANGIPLGKGLIGTCALKKKEVLCSDVKNDKTFHSVTGLPDTKAEVCFPLIIENKVIGVLDVQSNFLNGFHQNDLLVLQILVDAIANAINNAGLLQNIQTQSERIQVVSEITRALSSILDLDKLLDEIVNIISQKFGFPYVHIFTIDRVMNRVVFRTGTGKNTEVLKANGLWFDLESEKGIVAFVARKKKPYLSVDVLDDDLYLPTDLPPHDPRSELAIPIVFSGEVLGVLDIQSPHSDAFSDKDVELFRMLSDGIAIALQNAQIYRSERWRRKVAESFHEIANIFSRDYSLEEIYKSVLKIASQNLPCTAGVIWHLSNTTKLSVADSIGVEKDDLNASILEEDLEFVKYAIEQGEPIIRYGYDESEPLGRFLKLKRNYSAIVAPIINANQKLGAIEIVYENPNRYGEEARAVLKAFAGYTSVAIQNLGLFSASQEQALMATTLLLVSEATEHVETSEELFATVARLIQFVVGVKKTLIYQRERNGQFTLAASVGAGDEDEGQYRAYPDTFEGILTFSRMLGEQPAEYQSVSFPESGARDQNMDWLAIPIKTQDKVLGALFVQLDEEMSEHDFLGGSGAKQREVLSAVARQSAIALENLIFKRSQQTEAYVTAVLLQVAEAVVSSADINETLENIVNILPFLVGVDCVMFLIWDKNRNIFRIANSFFGKWKQELEEYGEYVQPQDYEPLKRLLDEKVPIYLAIDNLNPESWFKQNEYKILTDRDAVLEIEQDVQLLYPLQDREEFYGVMLVTDSRDQFEYREKRVDILNGVAQQLTLAFQNEHLKDEMVGRERLQKEFQLARDIQKAFLPEVIPQINGWEISVRWRPARQVGGDFYDFIKLPDGRLGFVIADVSDKGIPAALYMTVTRTLIHATAKEKLSPAQALLKVNRLLLESSPQGLFITTFYGILGEETGIFEYTNAGHNQPILIKKGRDQVVLLEKGGMPLGVSPDLKIENRLLAIGKGETLILYTDGVTEAQSPDGKLYGMNRFENFLLNSTITNMDHLLDALDKNILIFQKGFPPTDDLTIIALHRKG
jgi:serine phosphatase RsbU (regulator of sigma subunit)/putative methionine-R-sulfoxide reductase with GAF domain